MAFRDSDRPKLELAERLLESAEHSSEAEMRNSISRIYYAVLHLAEALTDVSGHGRMPDALNGIEQGLGDDFKWLRDLRAGADYNPNFARDQFHGTDGFRAQFREVMDSARTLYERILKLGSE